MTVITNAAPARRSFLALLTSAAAAPAAAAAALPPLKAVAPIPATATAEVRTGVAETPELLALGDRLTTLTAEFEAAITRKNEAIALYEQIRPAYPPEIVARNDFGRAEAARDLFGKAVMWAFAPQDRRPLFLYRSHLVQASIIGGQISRHTKEGKMLRRVVRVARQFEREEEAARATSDVDRRIAEVPGTEVCCLVSEIMQLQPTTMAGVMIFALAAHLSYRAMNWREGGEMLPSDYAAEALLSIEAAKVG